MRKILLLFYFQTTSTRWRWKLAGFWIFLFASLEILSLPVLACYTYHYSPKPSIRFFPGKTLAREADEAWREYDASRPCPFVTSARNDLLGWNIAVYSSFQPRIITSLGNWASDRDMQREGGIIVWQRENATPEKAVPEVILERFPNAILVKNRNLRYQQKNPNIPELPVALAIVPPAEKSPRPTLQGKK